MINDDNASHDTCHACDSINISKNGTNKCGNRQFHCKDCGVYRVLEPENRKEHPDKTKVLRTYRERASLRGIERIFNVCRKTVMRWLLEEAKALPDLPATLLPSQSDDVLELDEAWSFVGKKQAKRWLWTAICRRTRQIVAFVIGDHSEATCRQLWQRIPEAYRHCTTFTDFWKAYQAVMPAETHQSVGKESGETAHMERWYGTLRQWVGRYTRRTLSFSKTDFYHCFVTSWFITHHNIRMLGSSLTLPPLPRIQTTRATVDSSIVNPD